MKKKFDIEAFRNRIKENVTIQEEGYELNFLGKSYAKLLASLDTDTIIVPDSEHNSLPENQESKNIYISGDNLDALKHLLNSYCGQVKCIYIDPPYNTGKDEFAYNDKFEFTEKNLEEKLSVGWSEARRILDLTKKSKASHSAWLTFMYPRLTLARDLLSSNGIIFISIDDNEQANLKLLCDYIFGEENCLGTIIWKNATDNNPTNIACEHEYILCYAQNKNSLESVWKSPLSDVKEVLIAKGKELTSLYKGDELQKRMEKNGTKKTNGNYRLWTDINTLMKKAYTPEVKVYTIPGKKATDMTLYILPPANHASNRSWVIVSPKRP